MGTLKYAILSSNPIYKSLEKSLEAKTNLCWFYIDNPDQLKYDFLKSKKIEKIFIPHWSFIIKEEIFENFECVLFHMTDLPFGRGGSPLQNLIKMGYTSTKISAIKVISEIDAGPIYLKQELSLNGSAKEIFNRASFVIEEMIFEIIESKLKPYEQEGEPTYFKRRKPSQSEIKSFENINNLYDHIRMLDCEGYPKAFIKFNDIMIEFEDATLDQSNDELKCNARIFKK